MTIVLVGKPHVFEKEHWKRLLFKEEIIDQARLRVQITDRDAKSRFLGTLRKILAVLVGAGLGKSAKGISNVYLGAVAKMGIDQTTRCHRG